MKLTKDATYALLDACHIPYEAYQHAAAYTIDDLAALDIPHKDWIVKNLFLRDDKRRNYYLVTIPGYKTVDLKRLSEKIPSRRLSFADEDTLFELLELPKGNVTPLGVLNHAQHQIISVFDSSLHGQKIGIHPMINTETVFVAFEDILRLLEERGHPVVICDIDIYK